MLRLCSRSNGWACHIVIVLHISLPVSSFSITRVHARIVVLGVVLLVYRLQESLSRGSRVNELPLHCLVLNLSAHHTSCWDISITLLSPPVSPLDSPSRSLVSGSRGVGGSDCQHVVVDQPRATAGEAFVRFWFRLRWRCCQLSLRCHRILSYRVALVAGCPSESSHVLGCKPVVSGGCW